MTVSLQPIQIIIARRRFEGRLVFLDGALCAVVSRLDPELDEAAGWQVEAGFDRLDYPLRPTFADEAQIAEWVMAEQAAPT